MTRLYSYHGNEPYIFISYAHKDKDAVYPVISKMQSDGYRVWFDEGIDPGTEWDETIAESIDNCGYFIALVSNNYIDSNNCKDELKYARDLSKKSVLVYLEDVILTRGMAMRMNRIQSIFKHFYEDESEFYKKLYSSDGIAAFTSGQSIKAENESTVRFETINHGDGSTYTGEVNELGERHGKGSLRLPKGDFYDGEFIKGRLEGYGTYRFADGGFYEGEFKDNKICGRGVLHLKDGSVYEGEMKDNKLSGQGIMRHANGDVYEGGFENDKYEGYGTKTFADGRSYKGEFLYGFFHGKGVYELEDGAVYDGEFILGVLDGRGVLRCPDGKVYDGEFKNNRFDGRGTLNFANGNVYIGEFKDNDFNGRGVLKLVNGDVYEAVFKDGKIIS